MSASKLDAVYRSILITKFFTKGWGKPENLRRLFEFRKVVSNRDECFKLIPRDYPVTITKEEKRSDCHILEGHFLSPLEVYLPGVVPECAQQAHFQVIMPSNWAHSDYKPMCVHLAGTGDHFFWRRRNLMAKPLLKDAGIGSILLENPFYGLRKPNDQVRSSLHNVSDIFVMGGCLILEALVLFHWCERNGLGPLGVTGLSMGGHMASLAATNWPKPLVLVPCLSWSTASAVFTQGVMSQSINWELLETQFFSDGEYRNNLAKMVTIVDEAFLAGRKFAQRFSKSSVNPVSDLNSFNLPSILNNTYEEVKKIDLTNPNNISRIQGLHSETSQDYGVITNSNEPETSDCDADRNSHNISEGLLIKITSREKFSLEPGEITELNELAFQTLTDSNSDGSVPSVSSNSIENKVSASNSDKVETTAVSSECVESKPTSKDGDVNVSISNDAKDVACKDGVKDEKQSTEVANVSSNGDNGEKNSLTKNILSNILFLSKEKEDPLVKWRNREALQFMRGVMDECTHLGNFSVPYDTSLIIAVCAKHDAYVPRGNSGALEELWPGAEVRYIDAGHVSAYVLHQSLFRSCIVEAFERSRNKLLEEKENSKCNRE